MPFQLQFAPFLNLHIHYFTLHNQPYYPYSPKASGRTKYATPKNGVIKFKSKVEQNKAQPMLDPPTFLVRVHSAKMKGCSSTTGV